MIRHIMLLIAAFVLAACAGAPPGQRQAAAVSAPAVAVQDPAPLGTGYQNWASVIVAGDWRSGASEPTETFDNARRAIASKLAGIGFPAARMRQISSRPRADATADATGADFHDMAAALKTVARGSAGCLLYVTSHGNDEVVLVGRHGVRPDHVADLLDVACAGRPKIVVISACYSGIFVRRLAAPDTMVMTAARPDRPSFGCGVDSKYPYFDQCVLQEFDRARDFPALARAAAVCVDRREKVEGMRSSGPQLSVGAEIDGILHARPLH
ncbi:C13 family peptidase [Zavarzinia compransoris]|uniref:C13 family peptidase n=1 Tax=Zavarzinia marina TaxID=2911065 RepID=UPI001F4244DC|nr:C13 family peptidase [Zavarzinia marina]MCF4167645.1 C13 family peptidase [Zavarzinia marina]